MVWANRAADKADAPANPREATSVMPLTLRQLPRSLSAASEPIVALVRLWREARAECLQFLCDLHDADEDRVYLSQVVLPANDLWVAEVEGTLAGFIAFREGWVNHLYVAPQFQGRGVGSTLLEVAQRRSPTLQLWAFEVNRPAIAFYERRGFRIVEHTDGASNEAKRPDARMQWDRPSAGAWDGQRFQGMKNRPPSPFGEGRGEGARQSNTPGF
jgi:putative acetyltransferase